MTRKRKTRKEKKLADIRRIEHTTNPSSSSTIAYTFAAPTHNTETPKAAYSDIVNHDYVLSDIRKTVFISTFLVTFNLIVYALLRSNYINLNFLGL